MITKAGAQGGGAGLENGGWAFVMDNSRRPRLRTWLALALIALGCQVPVAGVAQDHGAKGTPLSVPVSVAPVTRRDVPILLRGLGTIQALQTVQLRSRVDGTLMRVPVTEGQDVKQGDLLAVIDPRPYQALLDAAMAKKGQDQAQLAMAKSDLARYSRLAEQEVTSRQKLEATQALVGQITATIAADDAQIDAAKLNLGFCYITAPFDGRVGLRAVDPGNFIRAAEVTSFLPLAQLRPIAVTFTVPQDNLPALLRAMAAGKAPVVAFASDDKTELDRGTLLTIENTIDVATGTIRVKATFPNTDYRLWPGQFVNARLLVGTSQGALTVPSVAVQHGQNQLFVYVVEPDQTVARKVVEVARDDGTLAIVTKGLEEGQLAVTDGHSRLQVGARVSTAGGTPKQTANPRPAGG